MPLPVGPVTRTMPHGRSMASLNLSEGLVLEAELGQVELEHLLVEDTGDDLLPEQGRQGGDAHVDLFAVPVLELDPHLDPAVLGEALLGDVHVREDLDPREDGAPELQGQADHLVEVAVDAVADAELLFVGLEVDVRSALLDGVDERRVDEGDDRRLFARGLDLLEGDVILAFLDDVDPAVVGQGDVLDDLLDLEGVGRPIVLVDGVHHPGLGGDDRLDAEPGPEPDVLDDLEVGRVDHRQGQEGPDPVDGHDHVLLGHVGRDEVDDLGIDLELVEVDIRVAELAAQGLGDLLLGNEAEGHQARPERQAVLLLEIEGGLQLVRVDDLFTQEKLAEV